MLTRLCATLLVVLTVVPFTHPLASCEIDDLLAYSSATHFSGNPTPRPTSPSVTGTVAFYALPAVAKAPDARQLLRACSAALSLGSRIEPPVARSVPLVTGPEVLSQDTKFVLRI